GKMIRCLFFLQHGFDEASNGLASRLEYFHVAPRNHMDDARPCKQLVPRHLWMEKSCRSAFGYNDVYGAGEWTRDILFECNRHTLCDRRSRVQLPWIARIKRQVLVAVGIQHLFDEPGADLL